MQISARPATSADGVVLTRLYDGLRREMTDLHPMWPLADGLPEPVEDSFAAAVDDADTLLLMGEVDAVPMGFLLARVEDLLPQAEGRRVGAIRLIYTDELAREVGVAEAMLTAVLEELRKRGITRFDAHVLPGHRLAKNFFEAGGFSARSIVMHADDEPSVRPGRDPRRF